MTAGGGHHDEDEKPYGVATDLSTSARSAALVVRVLLEERDVADQGFRALAGEGLVGDGAGDLMCGHVLGVDRRGDVEGYGERYGRAVRHGSLRGQGWARQV
jgi:hypothetical protein